MKRTTKFLLVLIMVTLLTGCYRTEKHYESKNVEVESAFDDLGSDDKVNATNEDEEDFQPHYMEADTSVIFRTEPDRESLSIRTVAPGERVFVMERGLGDDFIFSKVVLDETVGYIATEHLRDIESDDTLLD